ncbi:chemotaxis protein CheB [Rhodopirellula baltica]|uniref:histidine kinase n=1 Tax=Rhodopirellula baltica SWK14 TaxID=993516 RepID=L7CB53_RHOBT|nr:chemotaxis protein CheB [Rhodopirellula baltica]ELP31045.1 signal transduction histidine kinase with CheB and CheR activity [Rhodopirellula baltica SWK14]
MEESVPGFAMPSKVVGIGASAGGLQSLEALFDELNSETGLAIIVIQHLSPDFDSMMDQLLSRHSDMPVCLIEDGMYVKPNHIYLLPPGQHVIISNRRLLLAERAKGQSLSFQIDEFFRTLAQDAGPDSVGIILSGTGTDGSRGVCDIAAAGGMVIVETTETAAFDGMPRSAYETGVADLVLSPPEIAKALHRIAGDDPTILNGAATRESLDPGQYLESPNRLIFGLLHNTFNIDFSQYKTEIFSRHIERRLRLAQKASIHDYIELLRTDTDELNQLYSDMLIGPTDFFRDSKAFDRLELDVFPQLVDDLNPQEDFRCWVAGTATGEEAYTLAIQLAEEFDRRGIEKRIRIFASDVHDPSLLKAGRGVFTHDRLASITPERLEKYFIERQDGFHVTPEIRKLVVFTPHNVIRDAPFTRLDLISCRNLLIYLTPATQQRVLSLFHFGLKTGGVVCLGNSESLGDLRNEFQPLDESLRIYRKFREISSTAPTGVAIRRPWPANPPAGTEVARERTATRQLLKTYDKLLEKFLSPAILINSQKEILHVFGGAGAYLSFNDGRPQNHLLNIILPELRSALSIALVQLNRDGNPVAIEQIPCSLDGQQRFVKLTVDKFEIGNERDGTALIQIETQSTQESQLDIDVLTAEQVIAVEYLERELQFTQSHLQSTIEEHQSTNEELQSTNEQLTASNEELQSTNEELHSVNEELYTVNAEHQRKIDELTELNDDIDNLLTTTNVHTLFLDSRLRLRRFTPRIAELFNLIPQDIGRPINAFTHRLQDPFLTESIKEVIQTEQFVQREIKDENGQWYLLRIFPYLSRGTVEGAVVTLVDVTMLQAATEALQKSEERFDLAVRGSNAGIWDWKDVTKEAIWCSRRMYALLGRTPTDEMTVSLWEELIHPDDHARVMAALNSHLESNTPFDIEYRMEYGTTNEYRWFHMRGSAERKSGRSETRMAGSFEDVTQRREAQQEVKQGVARRDQFLAMLSHELRNPLGAVTNAIAIMSSEETKPDVTERALGVVKRQLGQMSRLLDDLLDVSRITHGKIELRKQQTDLTKMIEQAVITTQSRADGADLELTVALPSTPLIVDGDPARLEQVTMNLLTNAVKYTPPGGKIRLELKDDGQNAYLEVQDNGAGISSDKLNEIFSLFYQSDETLDRSNGGMGVGLTLVKAVVELHDGSVTAKSDGIGCGSTFTVTLPLSCNEVIDANEAPQSMATKLQSIVLVEDIDDAREMLSGLLELRGLNVYEASDGAAGWNKIREINPHAAIIDIGLPVMDGHELARRIRSDPAHSSIKLVALTGYGQDKDREAVRESGFDLHLVKPLNPEKLDQILTELSEMPTRSPPAQEAI